MGTPSQQLNSISKSEGTSAAIRRTVNCHVCGSTRDATYLQARGYRVAQCSGCGLWFVNPQPTARELSEFYASYDDGHQWRHGEEIFNCGIRDAIRRYRKNGTVMDVGCGSGNFLKCMHDAGFSTFGIEPSQTGSEYGRSVHGIEIFQGMVEDYLATNPARTFDAVTLLNVLEHFTDPRQSLLQLRQCMNDGGLLAVVVPDARFHAAVGWVRKRLGSDDPYLLDRTQNALSGFKLPDHLCSFEPRTIRALLERCGFAVKAMRHAPLVLNPTFRRNFAKFAVKLTSDLLQLSTLGHFQFGYSTLVVAQKTPLANPAEDGFIHRQSNSSTGAQ
jgi:2-polyprenyl-3-methyl-5-hydroxy-6-metoxy-1,4-benzoquinol methylase